MKLTVKQLRKLIGKTMNEARASKRYINPSEAQKMFPDAYAAMNRWFNNVC